MLSGCQNHIISSMKTERHNVAGRMIIKALNKSPWGAGLVNMDIGSGDRLAQHNFKSMHMHQTELYPLTSFQENFSKRSRLTSSRPDAILITPYKAKPLLLLLLPPAHTIMCYAADTNPH